MEHIICCNSLLLWKVISCITRFTTYLQQNRCNKSLMCFLYDSWDSQQKISVFWVTDLRSDQKEWMNLFRWCGNVMKRWIYINLFPTHVFEQRKWMVIRSLKTSNNVHRFIFAWFIIPCMKMHWVKVEP